MAVVLALSLAVKDAYARWRERSAHHLLVAATARPTVAQTVSALEHTRAKARRLLAEEASIEALRACCDSFLNIVVHYGLDDLRGVADQVGALPEKTLIPLIKAMTLSRMLAYNGQIESKQHWGHGLAEVRASLVDWEQQATQILTSLEWVEFRFEKQLASTRWRFPERSGW